MENDTDLKQLERRKEDLDAAPVEIKEPEKRFDYQRARGCAPSLTGLSPEEAIRRIRDCD